MTLALVFLILFAGLWFGGLGYRKLADPDEGRYAEIPREMVASGNWVTPRLNGIKYFEKPPLQYWVTAAIFDVFGVSDWGARLWPALTGFLGVLMTGIVGGRLWGRRTGVYGALVLGASFQYAIFGHLATLDMGLTFFLSAAIFSFVLAQVAAPRSASEFRWMLVAWISMGLAVLTKGLIGVVLPLLSLGIYSVVQRDPTPWRRLHALPGLTIFSLLTVPWFVAVSMANPEFLSFFFIHEHFARYSTGEHHRIGPFWYFVPIVLIGMLPWTVFLPRAIHESWSAKQMWAIGFAPGRFLVLWIATVFGFFSISSSKLPAYVLPLVPAFALLVGMHVSRLSSKRILRYLIPGTVLVGVGIMVASEILEIVHDSQDVFPLYENYSRWLEGGALLLVATSALIPLFVRGKSLIVVWLASTSLLTTQVALTGFESLSPVYSAYETAKELRPYLKPGTRVFSVGRYDQSLPRYLQSPVILVADADELDFGLRQEPTRWLPSLAAFKSAWSNAESAAAVMSLESYETLRMEGLPMIFLSRTGNRVAVVKP